MLATRWLKWFGWITMLLGSMVVRADDDVRVVAYVEVLPTAAADAHAAFQQYANASQQETGLTNLVLLQELDRPGRWVVLESWLSQTAWIAHANTNTRWQTSLQSWRLGSYDQRLYHALFTDGSMKLAADNTVYVITHVDIGGMQRNVDELLQQYCRVARMENGNLECMVWQGKQRSNHFTLVSIWRDQAAWRAHRATEQTRVFRNQVEPLTGSPIDERIYRLVR